MSSDDGGYSKEQVDALNHDYLVEEMREKAASFLSNENSPQGYSSAEVRQALQEAADLILPMSGWMIGDWRLKTSGDGEYLYVSREDKPGEIHIKADSEGYVLDVWPSDETADESVATMAVLYEDLDVQVQETQQDLIPEEIEL